MKAAVFKDPDQLMAIEAVDNPKPGPGQLLLKVNACGVCGSDLHAAAVREAAGGMRPLPSNVILGHEFAGEIVEIGAGVEGWSVGQRVTSLPGQGCGACLACLSGQGHRCVQKNSAELGSSQGAYAEQVVVGAFETMSLPDTVDDGQGALVEPMAVGLHAVKAAYLQTGDSVLVVGAGPIGLAVAMWSKFFGAAHVAISDLSDARLSVAQRLGIDHTINAKSDPVVAAYKSKAGGRPAVVFDCVGVPGSQQLCMDYAPMLGRIVVVGVCMHDDTIQPTKAITKELSVRYVYCYERADFQFTIDMMAAGRINPSAMISARVGFDEFPDLFAEMMRPTDHCKVLLKP